MGLAIKATELLVNESIRGSTTTLISAAKLYCNAHNIHVFTFYKAYVTLVILMNPTKNTIKISPVVWAIVTAKRAYKLLRHMQSGKHHILRLIIVLVIRTQRVIPCHTASYCVIP